MKDQNAQQLLATVMNWKDHETVLKHVPPLQLLADQKYDSYQRYGPGKRFIESLALWLKQFREEDRAAALELVERWLVFLSDAELSHIVQMAYPDLIVPERMRLVSEELGFESYRIGQIAASPRFGELQLKSLYLGLSDGARTSELRRASGGEIGNEQIWQAYELGSDKIEDMKAALTGALKKRGLPTDLPRFNLIWLLDDFSGSGNTYIRYDAGQRKFKGKLKKVYELLERGELVDPSHYDVFLLLYVATRQALEHIEYWSERFTSERGYKPLQVRVLLPIEHEVAVPRTASAALRKALQDQSYADQTVSDVHFRIGGTEDVRLGFAGCALPLVLCHNTPNNSVFLLWGPEGTTFPGLFPRVSRHREF